MLHGSCALYGLFRLAARSSSAALSDALPSLCLYKTLLLTEQHNNLRHPLCLRN